MEKQRIILLPGYFTCKKILFELEKFQNLIPHHSRWAHQLSYAKPIKELIQDFQEKNRHWLIRREINRLIPLVRQALAWAGIETLITTTKEELEYNFEKNATKK